MSKKNKTIIIADDSKFMRMNLKNILLSGGFEVIAEAENGMQAVELYEKLKPDVLTLDITMPKLDGMEALKLIIDKVDKNAKIIMVSAMGQQEFKLEAFSHGAKDFIVKPFVKERVIAAIERV